MNKDVKQAWVTALRSGEYKRDVYQLRSHQGYDPVGVLCELAVSDGVIDPPEERVKRKDSFFDGFVYDGSSTHIPDKVSTWADLPVHTAYRIAMLNDKGKNFNAIADYIEETL